MSRHLSGNSRRGRLVGTLVAVALVSAGVVAVAGPAAASAGDVANDEFDRTIAGGLGTAPSGGNYVPFPSSAASLLSVSDGRARITGLSPGKAVGAALVSTSASDVAVNSSIVIDEIPGSYKALYYALEARRQSDGTAYRARVKVSASGALTLSYSRTKGSQETYLAGSKKLDFLLSGGQRLNFEFSVTGTDPVHLQSRAWLDGTSVPAWQTSVDDGTPERLSSAGAVGMWSYASSSGSKISFSVPQLSAGKIDSAGAPAPAPTPPPAPAPAPTPPAPPAAATGKPSASNTGVPAGTALTKYTGPLTITTDGTVIDGKAVYGDLRIQAKNVVIRNSYLHCGADIPPNGNSGCIDANSAKVYNLLIENNTIIPDRPSYYRDGIVGHEFTARRNHISRSNDGIGIFNRPGGSVQANVTVEWNYIHDLTHWNFDPAHVDGTHNDGIEVQGGENIFIRYNFVDGTVVAGDGLGVFGLYSGAALIVVQNVAKINNMVVEKNWFDGGQNSVCIQNSKYADVRLTLQSNYFGRDQYRYSGNSTYQIRIYSKSRSFVTGLFTNVWEDTGTFLAEGRDLGIRYNSP